MNSPSRTRSRVFYFKSCGKVVAAVFVMTSSLQLVAATGRVKSIVAAFALIYRDVWSVSSGFIMAACSHTYPFDIWRASLGC